MWRRNRVRSTDASTRPRDSYANRRYITGRFLNALHQTPPAPLPSQLPFPLATIKVEILKSVLAMAADAPASTSAPRSRRASTAGKADAVKPASKAAAKKPATKAKTAKAATKKAPVKATKKDAGKSAKAPAAHPSWKDMIKVCLVDTVHYQGLMYVLRSASSRTRRKLVRVSLARSSRRFVIILRHSRLTC